MLSRVCLAKKVLVKPVSSVMGWFFASAHQLVKAKLLEVFSCCACPLFLQMPVAHGVAVVLGQRAVADDEQLHVLEQAGARPEAVALVAVDLVEGLADVHAPALQLDVHHRQAVDQHGHVVAVGAPPAATRRRSYWLMTCKALLWMLACRSGRCSWSCRRRASGPGRDLPGCARSFRRCRRWRRQCRW
jgi:hypothetical protein